MVRNPMIPAACSAVMMGFYLFNMCMIGSLLCRSDALYRSYIGMFKTFPHNVCFLTLISAVFGTMVGFITLQYSMHSVLFIFALCAVLVVALTAFAVRTESDFTGMGPYIFVAVLGLMLTGLLLSFAMPGGAAVRLYAG